MRPPAPRGLLNANSKSILVGSRHFNHFCIGTEGVAPSIRLYQSRVILFHHAPGNPPQQLFCSLILTKQTILRWKRFCGQNVFEYNTNSYIIKLKAQEK